MIRGFDQQTRPLTPEEMKLVPLIVSGLNNHVGRENAITSHSIMQAMERRGIDLHGSRLRKIIHHIREQSLTKWPVLATSSGYYTSNDPRDIQSHIDSLKGREDAIKSIRVKLEQQLSKTA